MDQIETRLPPTLKYYQSLLRFHLILLSNYILDCRITSVNHVELYYGMMKEFINLEMNVYPDFHSAAKKGGFACRSYAKHHMF